MKHALVVLILVLLAPTAIARDIEKGGTAYDRGSRAGVTPGGKERVFAQAEGACWLSFQGRKRECVCMRQGRKVRQKSASKCRGGATTTHAPKLKRAEFDVETEIRIPATTCGRQPPGVVLPSSKYRVVVFSKMRRSPNLPKPAETLVGMFVGSRTVARLPRRATQTNRPGIENAFDVGLHSPSGVRVEFIVPEKAERLYVSPTDCGDGTGSFEASITVRKHEKVELESPWVNGCGGQIWGLEWVQNMIGDISDYYEGAQLGMAGRGAKSQVYFRDACNVHDAGYWGVVVRDPLHKRDFNFRGWSRKEVDEKFVEDLRLICERDTPPRSNRLRKCLAEIDESIGNFRGLVRRARSAFDADPSRKGAQPYEGPRTND